MKECPKGHKPIDILYSQNRIWCFECRCFYNFPLKPGKKSILIKGLKGK